MFKKILYFYPLYFAIFPTLTFYSGNKKELQLGSILTPLIYSIVFLIVLWVLLYVLLRHKDKTNVLTLVIMLYFFSYGYFTQIMQGFNLHIVLSFTIYTVFFVSVLVFLLKLHKKKEVHVFLSIVGVYLLVSAFFSIVPYEIQRQSIRSDNLSISNALLTPVKKKDTPDIYYIILDRYANNHVLKEQYYFDNEDFFKFLRSNGFYIADLSFANYPKTHLSLASSLNLDYLNELVKKAGEANSDYTPAFTLVQNNKVAQFLKSSGYQYIYFGDWWGPTSVNKLADRNINLYANSNEFIRKFLQTTILATLLGDYHKGNRFFGFFQDRIYENTNYKFAQLEEIAKEKSPKFIFAHMLFPHHPYLFDKNCRRVDDRRNESEDEKYIAQLKCANKKIKKTIKEILNKSKKPPIIVLQSDEGPFKVDEMKRDGEGTDWTKISDTAIRRHMTILNAYYLPDFEYGTLYSSVTPVNTFRIILNHYFGKDFQLLPDRSYIIPHINRPYKYLDITDRVQFKK